MDAFSVIELNPEDLDRIVQIHMEAFPDSMLTLLGAGAVKRYYTWQFEGPHELYPSGVWKDGELVAFCFGGKFRGAFRGFLDRNWFYLILQVLRRPWLIFHPVFRERLPAVFPRLPGSGIRQEAEKRKPAPGARSFGVLSVAVDPAYQGKGTGRLLLEEAEKTARANGFSMMNLTVHPENTRAVDVYLHMGWEKISGDGDWDGTMWKLFINTGDAPPRAGG